jgi:hypothetical protein
MRAVYATFLFCKAKGNIVIVYIGNCLLKWYFYYLCSRYLTESLNLL